MSTMFQCSNPDCRNQVAARRPSKSGDHFCRKPECQAIKQKNIRSRRRAAFRDPNAPAFDLDVDKRAFVRACLQPRRVCPDCGLENAVSGYGHRSAPGAATYCTGVGGGGRTIGPLWLDLPHPERVKA